MEIAHEALLSAWGRLRTWIDEARDDLRQERGLARAAAEWRGSDGDKSFLVRGARLEQLETWAAVDGPGDRPTRACLPEGERRSARPREGGGGAAKRARGADRAAIGAPTTGPCRRLRGRGAHRRIAHRRRDEPERQGGSGRPGSRERGSSPRPRWRTWRSTRSSASCSRSRPSGPRAPRTGRFSRKRRRRSIAPSLASRLELEVPGVGGLLAWSPTGVFVTEGPEGSGMIDIRDGETRRQRPLVPGARRGHQRRRVQLGRLEARLHRGRRHAEGVGPLDRATRLDASGRWTCIGPFLQRRRFARRRGLGWTGRSGSWTCPPTGWSRPCEWSVRMTPPSVLTGDTSPWRSTSHSEKRMAPCST